MNVTRHPRRRTQAERRAASEDALLRAAAELIAERGFERTSLRSIAGHAGTSREMPAYHFGSKESLIARLADRAPRRTLDATTQALERTDRRIEDLSAFGTLRVAIKTYLETFGGADAPEERALLVLWGATFPSGSVLPALVDADRQTHRDIAETIRAGQQDGSIRADVDADATAVVVMGMARGVAAICLAHPDAADPRNVRAACDVVISASLQAGNATATSRGTRR